jgi:hypothetical protein
MDIHAMKSGCYGPSELKMLGMVFDELWCELSPHFHRAGAEFVERVRTRLALDVLAHPTASAADLKLRARDAFLLRFPVAA